MIKEEKETVFIVDDDAAVRDSILELLESVGLHAKGYRSGAAFLDSFRPETPGCLIVDVRMAEMSGLVLQQKLNALGATVPVIILTGHGDVQMAVEAMKAGAVDFIEKPYREQALLDSINAALSLDARSRETRKMANAFDRGMADLTIREKEVLDYLLAGESSKDIGRELNISPRTVDAHRSNVLRKFGVRSATELIRLSSVTGKK